MSRPLSVQLYSVRTESAADRAGTLGRLAAMGYGAVEAFDVTDDAAGLRRITDDLGLDVSGAHVVQVLTGDPGRVFDAVATLGTDLAIVPAGFPHEDFTAYDGLARVAERLNSLAARAGEHGLRLGYHNHWWEIEPRLADHGGRHALEVLAELLDPAVFLEVDTYWAAVGGADVPALLGRLGERVAALHLKDGPGTKDDPNVAVGGGTMPVPEVLDAAPGAWRVVEFDACAGDLFGELQASRAYVSALEAV
ncbi:sugar phosphate isomerase/epimerase family protein [Streptomyces silvensis]|uniref:Xylose isomerase n=1 Tax=Streptomyces silvensis TaxID=1765722 RepID=A0A0W7WVY9_9ACTN|nr:sugar phosphate isomerase/epimerase [Streptomyces silvensis]KUF14663.1 xylose isomerase [Streptomyces silvensis]